MIVSTLLETRTEAWKEFTIPVIGKRLSIGRKTYDTGITLATTYRPADLALAQQKFTTQGKSFRIVSSVDQHS